MERALTLTRTVLGAPVIARVLVTDGGVQVSLTGGDRPHIGAVSVADPSGQVSTTEFPSHREGVLSDHWARALAQAGWLPAVVTAGVHYDGISKEGITAVCTASGELLEQVLRTLEGGAAGQAEPRGDAWTGPIGPGPYYNKE